MAIRKKKSAEAANSTALVPSPAREVAAAPPRKPTVLITGAAGALAQRVIARLSTQWQVVAVDFRRKVTTDAGIPSYKVQIDSHDFEDIFRAHKIDAVIHIGRIFTHELTRQHRFNGNVLGTKHLLDLCRRYGVGKVIIHSTFYVYGANPFNPALMDEDTPLKASGLTADLVDSVELENLAAIYLWKHPELNITILRPVNVLGPGVRNTMSLLLARKLVPALVGFSPLMQFLHVEDMAEAVLAAFTKNVPGIYNVAPDDYVPYQEALAACGCRVLPIATVPPFLPRLVSTMLNWNSFFPPYLIEFFRYPVILDGRRFAETFGWKPRRTLMEIFAYYRKSKWAS